MPTYRYKNIETGEIYELIQSMRDPAYTHHPQTGVAIKRILATPAIAFKGSGFYANDSRPRSASGSGQSSETKTDQPKPTDSKSTESKPAQPSTSAGGSQ